MKISDQLTLLACAAQAVSCSVLRGFPWSNVELLCVPELLKVAQLSCQSPSNGYGACLFVFGAEKVI